MLEELQELTLGSIINCANKSNIFISGSGIGCVGGISGTSYNNAIINMCYNSGTLEVNKEGTIYLGGIEGNSYSDATVESCYNVGNIIVSRER